MRRLAVIAVLSALLLPAGCSKKDTGPQGPFVPLVQRLPAQADVVALLDLAGVFAAAEGAEKRLEKLPLLAKHEELRALITDQIALGRASLVMLKGKLGLDPRKDLKRAALAVSLPVDGDAELVAVVEGVFPPDFLKRLLPGVEPRKVSGHDVYPGPEGLSLAMLQGGLLVAAPTARMASVLTGPEGAVAKIAVRHPGLFDQATAAWLLRASVVVPAQVAGQLQAIPGVGSFAGVQRISLDAGHGMRLSAACRDDATLEHVRTIFESWAEMIAGSQHLVRCMAYWAMALDLDEFEGVDGLPAGLQKALADREALTATLEALLPEPEGTPPVRVDGKQVSLAVDARAFKGVLALAGLASTFVLPALVARQHSQADAELDRALEEAKALEQKGGAR